MEVLKLIRDARDAGLDLWVEDGVLRARGGKRHESLAKMIAAQKTEIIAVLTTPQPGDGPCDFNDLCSGDGTETSASPGDSKASSPAYQPRRGEDPWPSRKDEPVRWGNGPTRRLVGNGFPPHPPSTVSNAILADPTVLCPRCRSRPVLAELRELTGSLCYPCWEAGLEVRS
jgi:hypothetical protein